MKIFVPLWCFIVAQIIAFFSLVFGILSMQAKQKSRIIFLMGMSNLLTSISLLFLEGYAGVYGSLVATIRMFSYSYCISKKMKPQVWMLVLLEILSALACFISFEGWLSIILMIGYCFFTYASWQRNKFIIRLGSIIVSTSIIIYSVFQMGYITIVSESIIIISSFIGIFRYSFKKQQKKAVMDVLNDVELQKDVKTEHK